jgi:hypothetical protein
MLLQLALLVVPFLAAYGARKVTFVVEVGE